MKRTECLRVGNAEYDLPFYCGNYQEDKDQIAVFDDSGKEVVEVFSRCDVNTGKYLDEKNDVIELAETIVGFLNGETE